jgi:hypothetical protein
LSNAIPDATTNAAAYTGADALADAQPNAAQG